MRSKTSCTFQESSILLMLGKVKLEPSNSSDDLNLAESTDFECEIDFRAMVDQSMPLEYAKKHFAPALHTVIK